SAEILLRCLASWLQENKKYLEDFPIDINAPMEDNPALFIRPGGCMTARSSVFSVLLLSVDPDLQAQLEQDLRKATHTLSMTAAKDLASVPRAPSKRPFAGCIRDRTRGQRTDP